MQASYRSPYPPLEGTVRAPRALFIDRWGTLLQAPPEGYVRTASELAFYPGALDALFRASRAGWRLYLVGNEDAVAFGKLTLQAWEEIEKKMHTDLARAGVPIAKNYVCLDHPEGVPGRRNDSVYQLPNTGPFYHALHNDGINLNGSGPANYYVMQGTSMACPMAAGLFRSCSGPRAWRCGRASSWPALMRRLPGPPPKTRCRCRSTCPSSGN